MQITDIQEAKKHIGKTLYWDDVSNRYSFLRSGILDKPYRRQLAFDGNENYNPMSHYRNLRTEP